MAKLKSFISCKFLKVLKSSKKNNTLNIIEKNKKSLIRKNY
jgi:hypothetical protein